MRDVSSKIFLVGIFLSDLIFINVALIISHHIRFDSGWMSYFEYHPRDVYASIALVESFLFPIMFFLQQMYRFKRNVSSIDEFYKIFSAVSIGTVLAMAVSVFIARDFNYSRALLTLNWGLSVVLIWFGRMFISALQKTVRARGVGTENVVIIGTGEIGRVVLGKIKRSPGLGYKAIGFLDEFYDPEARDIDGVPLLGSISDVGRVVQKYGAREVIIAEPSLTHLRVLDIITMCEKEKVNIKVFPDLFQIMATEVTIGDLDGLPMVTVRDIVLKGWNLALKRTLDVMLSAILLVLLSPLLLFTALLIKITSPNGPVFFAQERVGLDGKVFYVIKFRSMRPDAEAQTGPVWAKKGDSRTTWLGQWLRRFSIDELPQFVNVLIGEMSIVGPRPERPYFVEQFSKSVPRYYERHKEKAGITGWAQVNGLRGDVSIEERTAYDLYYVENWTLWLDIKIILRTILTVLRDKNAY